MKYDDSFFLSVNPRPAIDGSGHEARPAHLTLAVGTKACTGYQPMLSFQPMQPPWEELEPASQGAYERQRQAVRDVSQFSGVVFVAVIAVVVLHTITHISSSLSAPGSLSDIARAAWPALATVLLSLLVLFTLWLLHHIQTRYLTQLDGTLLLLHVALFSATILLSVSAAWMNELGSTRDAVVLFSGNTLAIQALLLLIWRHAVRAGLLFGSDVPSRVVARLRLLLQIGTVSAVAVVGLSYAGAGVGIGALTAVFLVQILLLARGGYTLSLRRKAGRLT